MSEHTPSPTPSRGVMGFVLYLASTCSFALYLIWAFVPDSVLHLLGITYYPQKYWAIALPVYVLMGIALFAFFIYPGLNLLMVPPLDSVKTITDSYAVYKKVEVKGGITSCRGAGEAANVHGIPTASDIAISEVCRTLYLNQ
ncbi:UNVERIFIED_CONTAM: hypothetical protein PYX00_009746 [Menopon gallinae]|uniref:Phosphatidylinositol N-acetylglucosaminyltransferase subunit P n=1 Tax=Menopon gallinae TaxID=328185 RepID=A0AAW2HC50_9NEOP